MKCIVHIGLMKTGTTTLQEFFHVNRETILKHGVNSLRAESSNHSWAIVPAYQGCASAQLTDVKNAPCPEEGSATSGKNATSAPTTAQREAARQSVLQALEENRSPLFVISGEAIPTLTRPELDCLFQDLSRYFDEIQVVVYVREIVSYAESLINESVKRVRTTLGEEMKRFGQNPVRRMSYRASIEPFVEIVGRENVLCREFGRANLVDGDIVPDFIHATGLPQELRTHYAPQEHNTSTSHMALLVYSELFSLMRPNAQIIPPSMEMEQELRTLLNHFKSSKFRLPQRLATQIYTAMEEEISWLDKTFGVRFTQPKDRKQLNDDELVLANVYASMLAKGLFQYVLAQTISHQEFSQTVTSIHARHTGEKPPKELHQSIGRIILYREGEEQAVVYVRNALGIGDG